MREMAEMRRFWVGGFLRLAAKWSICVAALSLAGCQYLHTGGYKTSRDLGVESLLWREELAGRRVGVAIYTNVMNDTREIGMELKMTGPKSSSRMFMSPDKWRRRWFKILDSRGKIMLFGLTGSPWHRMGNGVGWNTETTVDGYPMSIPTEEINEALYAAARSAFESHGAKVVRIDASQTDGISLGHVAHSNRARLDYLFAVRHTYEHEDDGKGSSRCLSEVRASLFDTRLRRRVGWIFGKQDQKRWMKYRRQIEGSWMTIASQARLSRRNAAPLFRLQFSPESNDKTLQRLFDEVRRDLVDWPNKDRSKHAAQRPNVKPSL
jgi:hypothetical protein